MKAPEKIYLNQDDGLIWHCRSYKDDIEYIRTDAFIKKACAFLQDRIEHDSIDYPMATHWLIDDFKKYMEDKL